MPNGRPLLSSDPVFDTPELAIEQLLELKDRCDALVISEANPQMDIKA